ncbi:MAG: hypothetical protein JST54_15580 [Deltaproteobacteria bacterium]|nr:hypothetical protein [Deltaproteobacteria bacterium]
MRPAIALSALLFSGCVTLVPVERVAVTRPGEPTPGPVVVGKCALEHDLVVVDPAGHGIAGAEVRARVLVSFMSAEEHRGTFDYASQPVLTDATGHASICDPDGLWRGYQGSAWGLTFSTEGWGGDGSLSTGRRIEVRKDGRIIEAPPLWGGTMMVVLPDAAKSP